jgi:transcriptional regulator with XRE-family HTH domain
MTLDQQAFPQPVRIELTSDLGALVKARRREQSLRIDDAAALSGVSVDLLSRLENGKGSVRFDKLLSVLDGLGLALVAGPKDHPSLQPPPPARTKRP